MNDVTYWLLGLMAIVCFWSPWIFVSWWWAGDVLLSVATTLTALMNILLTCTLLTGVIWFYSIICHIVAWIVFVLTLSACACSLYSVVHFTCPLTAFYVHVTYVSMSCVLLFVGAMILLTLVCLVNNERKRDRWSTPSSWDLIAFCIGLRWATFVFMVALTFTWLPFAWIYTCPETPLSAAISSTVLALTLCLISLFRAVKDHDLFSTRKVKYVVVVVQYIVTWIVFSTSVYFNHNMWNSQTCHVVTVSFSLVNHVALGVALFLTSVWYGVYGCCVLTRSISFADDD